MEIKKVNTREEMKQFVQFYYDLYRDCDCVMAFPLF